ncbi:hypothetical protein NDU88_001047 [Pleurodeles waltl]|uniref:Secreted protein n=1 Tax=Pleurodeles waltl TaxID=8319 RepID=A0AAV7THJ5_PLEWA|nr:hypothetical protein NDU88_001047 [Pleurodeles waltl]
MSLHRLSCTCWGVGAPSAWVPVCFPLGLLRGRCLLVESAAEYAHEDLGSVGPASLERTLGFRGKAIVGRGQFVFKFGGEN